MSDDKEIAGSSNTEKMDEEEDKDDIVLDMWEAIKEQELDQEAAIAVLGAGDDKNCTYSEGYMKRQALYACLTCIPESRLDHTKAAGICLACSYHCHDGHELIELYTKRNFRCDCGNNKFDNFTCNLDNNKSTLNELNIYSQNFSGLYCICNRPFPDLEDDIVDEMNQCTICEDWFHSRHLGVSPTDSKDYAELICEGCVKKHEFLLYYDALTITKIVNEETKEEVNVVDDAIDAKSEDKATASDEVKAEVDAEKTTKECITIDKVEIVKELVVEPEKIVESEKIVEPEKRNPYCKKPKIKSTNICSKFMEEVDWRKQLCTCLDCLKMYHESKVSFLLDMEDPVQFYVEKGVNKVKEKDEKALEEQQNFMNSLDRVSLLEMLASYNEFKVELSEYLKKFADNKKVIRVEDVQEFFTQMKSRKRQKTEMSYYCR